LTDEQRTRVRAALARSTADMRTLIDDIIDLARGSEPDIAIEDVDFADVVAEVVEAARAHWPETDFRVSVSAHTVHGTRARLAKLVSNLVDNAAKFSSAGGAVDITLDKGVLAVRDHGPGIDEKDLGLVFERFYRSARSRGTAGSGLGLAMAQQIARAHGGVITAANAPDGGALFTVQLPPAR
jgi:two-component system sensor histidine kinase MprB